MAKLFKLALEEAVSEDPSIVEDVPVEEVVQNAEELAKTDSEIQQDIAAVEELVEEKTKLEEQVEVNDELLSNPDAVVSAADVEVSEETRSEVYYSLGYTSGIGKIRLSQESVANDVRSNPRKYLAISTEDIKETIKKIWEKIKAFFRKIWNKLKALFSKLNIFSKIEKANIAKSEVKLSEIKKTPKAKEKIKIKDLNKAKSVANEEDNASNYAEYLYTLSPYTLLALADDTNLIKALDANNYIKSLSGLTAFLSTLSDKITKEDVDFKTSKIGDSILEGIKKSSMGTVFSNIGSSFYKQLIDCTEGDDIDEGAALVGVYRNKIVFIGINEEKDDFIVFGRNFKSITDSQTASIVRKVGEKIVDVAELEKLLKTLKITNQQDLNRVFENIKNQNEELNKKVDKLVKYIESSDAVNETQKKYINLYSELGSPTVLAGYIMTYLDMRKATISLLETAIKAYRLS